jgi:hypothetical protein
MRNLNDPEPQARRVRVPGRNEIGHVIQEGKTLGIPPNDIYCATVYFPATGEVAFYEKHKLEAVSDE